MARSIRTASRVRKSNVRKSKKASRPAARKVAKAAARVSKPIDLYYWPTPNGWKITIMLEECGILYNMIPVNIAQGDQFKPEFLAISPNNRIPAIVDHEGPSRKPIAIFESGAILQYLGRKTGKLYPKDERGRVEVDQWLFWQMANLGPKAGEANHFRHYAAEKLPYAIDRFANEMQRIYGVMNTRLADREFLAGRYSIADIACVGWASRAERHGHDLSSFSNVRRWLDTVTARPAVKRGLSVKVEAAFHVDMKDPNVRAVLFGQKAPAGHS
jgi:GST-like protein